MNYREMMIRDLDALYRAENEHAEQLPQLAARAKSDTLRTALQEHAGETRQQIDRLRQIFEMLGQTPGTAAGLSPGVQGLVSEAYEKEQQVDNPDLSDLTLIAEAQKMEHYEMACYGTVRSMAQAAGMDDAAMLLQTTLDEEGRVDKLLTDIAMPIHMQAAQGQPANV